MGAALVGCTQGEQGTGESPTSTTETAQQSTAAVAQEPVAPLPATSSASAPVSPQETAATDVPWTTVVRTEAVLGPGVRIVNEDQGLQCTAGFIVKTPDGRTFVTAAGHCGNPGDHFAYDAAIALQGGELVEELARRSNRNLVGFGVMSESFSAVNPDDPETVTGTDIGLIEVDPSLRVPMTSQPTVDVPLAGWLPARELRAADRAGEPVTVCQLGFRTGMTCGTFIRSLRGGQFEYAGVAQVGDSGGPVFAQVDGAWWGIGVASGVATDTPDGEEMPLVGFELAPLMETYQLALFG